MTAVTPSASVLDEVVETRRELHRRPELSWAEHETSRYIEARLRSLGIRVDTCPTPTGAVGFLDSGRPGRTVLLRADIDGLPILEDSGEAFSSAIEGRMHGCGHDAHTAILLGVARALVERAESLAGSFLFVFQPAEEIVAGAREMIAAGLLERYDAASVLGLHTWAPGDSGFVLTRPGLMWSGSDFYDVRFSGPGGHGGTMGRAGNVISAQAFLVERLHTLVEGLELDGVPCHTTVGRVETDGAFNIVPRGARVLGSLRTFTPEMRSEGLQRLRDLLLEIETEFAVVASLEVAHHTVPLHNDPGVTATVHEVAQGLVGERATHLGRPLTVSDDVAEFLTRIPGTYFMLGCRPPDMATPPSHHSPYFRIDEAALATGVRVLAESAARLARPA